MTNTNFDSFLTGFLSKGLSSVFVGCICKIESVSIDKNCANIIPLLKSNSDRKEYGVIPDVPISRPINSDFANIFPYAKGDLVLALFPSLPIENSIRGQTEIDAYTSHGLQNAIIIGGVSTSIPDALQKDGMVIGHTSGSSYLNIQETEIDAKTSDKIQLQSGIIEVTATDEFRVKSDTIVLGNGTAQKALHGEDLIDLLKDLLDALSSITVTCTAPGSPSSTPINSTQFITIKAQLDNLLSDKVKNS